MSLATKPLGKKIKQAAGERHEFPRSAVQGPSIKVPSLDDLDGTDFQQDMIVAVFWGEMNFSGHDEKCWIEAVDIGERQVTVYCRARFFGAAALNARIARGPTTRRSSVAASCLSCSCRPPSTRPTQVPRKRTKSWPRSSPTSGSANSNGLSERPSAASRLIADNLIAIFLPPLNAISQKHAEFCGRLADDHPRKVIRNAAERFR